MTQHSEKHNGWTNYPTWRVNLEIFDGYQTDYPVTAESCQEMAEQMIWDACPYSPRANSQNLARDYALAFLSCVDWREIADHVNEANELTEAEA